MVEKVFRWMAGASEKKPGWTILVIVAITAFALAGTARIHQEYGYKTMLPKDKESVKAIDEIESGFGGLAKENVLVVADDVLRPDVLRRVAGYGAYLRSMDGQEGRPPLWDNLITGVDTLLDQMYLLPAEPAGAASGEQAPQGTEPRAEGRVGAPAGQSEQLQPLTDHIASLTDEELLQQVQANIDLNVQQAQAMGLAAAYAGIGFGNAGVHLCHGMSYPVSSLVRAYRAPGYPQDHPLVPHGISVALCAPAVFRFTGCAAPQRHLEALAALSGRSVQALAEEVPAGQAGEALAQEVAGWIRRLGLPNGLAALGFTREDAPALARGTLPQHRVTRLSPRPAHESELQRLFEASLEIWPAASSHASGSGAAGRFARLPRRMRSCGEGLASLTSSTRPASAPMAAAATPGWRRPARGSRSRA